MEANIDTIYGTKKVEVLKTFTYRGMDIFIHTERFDGGVAYKASEWKTGKRIHEIDYYVNDYSPSEDEDPVDEVEEEAEAMIDMGIPENISPNSIVEKNLAKNPAVNQGAMPIFPSVEE